MAFFTFQKSWCLFDKPADGKRRRQKGHRYNGLYHCCLSRPGLLGGETVMYQLLAGFYDSIKDLFSTYPVQHLFRIITPKPNHVKFFEQ
jgi:hypothetical protein